jgi:ABC-type spermidine/putrescine transport system permease subunit I
VAESVGATSIGRGGLGVEPFPSRPEARAWRREPATTVGLLLLAPAVLLLVALFVVPIVRIVWQALAEPTFGLDRFREFWTSAAPRRALVTTLRISGLVTLLCTTLSVLIAWELHSSRSRLVRIALWSATLFPLWTSGVVRNYAFTIILQRRGVLNTALLSLGLIREPLTLLYTEAAVVMGIFYTMLPYAILPVYASFATLDPELVPAAESLGASRLRAMVDVVLPLAAPSIFAAAVIVFVISVGFYITPILLGGPHSPFLATFVDLQIYRLFDFPGAAATASILFFTAFLVVGGAWRAVGLDRIRRVLG